MLRKILTIDNLVCIGIMLLICVFCVKLMQYVNRTFHILKLLGALVFYFCSFWSELVFYLEQFP
jgi:hypothetical protein